MNSAYGEYDVTLEDMIALAAENGYSFTPDQKRRIEALVQAMDITDPRYLDDLRKL
jgi:hypothetical protein